MAREADGIEHCLEGALVLVEIIFRRHADEEDQAFRPHQRHHPIRLTPTERGFICEVGRKGTQASDTDPLVASDDTHSGIGVAEVVN